MGPSVLQFAVAFGLMAAVVGVLRRIDRWVAGTPRRPRRRFRIAPRPPRATRRRVRVTPRRMRFHRPSGPELPVHRPLEVVAADLRRLSRELAAVPSGAPFVRWQALRSAYDAVLAEAAELLDVPHDLRTTPQGTPRDIERLRVLCALEAGGLTVSD